MKTTILDEEATGKDNEKNGDGARMDFPDDSFDVVITSDTLEHIPKKDRKNFIKELNRVSKDLVILCAPFNHGSVANEEKLSQDFFTELTGHEHRWLKEHSEYGLPNPSEIQAVFADEAKSVATFNHTSLDIWRSLMTINLISNEMGQKDVHAKTMQLNKYYNESIMFNDFCEDGYRTFIISSKINHLEVKVNKPLSSKQALGISAKMNDFYQAALIEAEYVPVLRKKVKALHDEKMKLLDIVNLERENHEHYIAESEKKIAFKVSKKFKNLKISRKSK